MKRNEFAPKCNEAFFTREELTSLREHGHALQSIATGHIKPLGDIEEQFFRLTKTVRESDSNSIATLQKTHSLKGKYQVFVKYWCILIKEGNLPEVMDRKITPLNRQIMEGRVVRGGHSSDEQNNRYDK